VIDNQSTHFNVLHSTLFRQTLNLTENLAIERENLVKELDTLK
jgi:hypothetical protein